MSIKRVKEIRNKNKSLMKRSDESSEAERRTSE